MKSVRKRSSTSREIHHGGLTLCHVCAGHVYYQPQGVEVQFSQVIA
ncbi:MAG: hypothetical protein HN975_16415 [Anaerolineae bacterium]|jgi:hypothetical protein|nr:hypothetical protein [Anaerolineae bacterium]MBT7989340.1 hypothetical protein [Anaerolineae bacterium]